MKIIIVKILLAIVLLVLGAFSSYAKIIDPIDTLEARFKGLNDYQLIETIIPMVWILRDNDPQTSLRLGLKAIELIQKTGNDKRLAELYSFLGVVYRNIGHYSTAQNYYILGLEQAEKMDDSLQIGYANNNIGDMFVITQNWAEAEKYLRSALLIFTKINVSRAIGYSYSKLGLLYFNLKNYDTALIFQKKSLVLRLESNENGNAASTYKHIGDIFLAKRQNDSALYYYQKSLQMSLKSNNRLNSSDIYFSFGQYYFETDDTPKAIENLKKSIELAKEINGWKAIKNSSQLLSKIYFAKGELAIAYQYKLLYEQATDTLLNEKSIRGIYEVMSRYKEKKEKELNLKVEKNNAIIRNVTILALLVTVIIIVGFIFFSRKIVSQNHTLSEQKSQIDIQHENMKNLNITKDKFFRIIAHDLKNPFISLNNVADILIDDWEEMTEPEKLRMLAIMKKSTSSTYSLLENLLTWARNESGKMAFEPANYDVNFIIKNVASILSETAKQKEIDLQASVSGSISAFCDVNMVNTVIRNLVSNAIKFTHKGGKVVLYVEQKEGMVEISISDTGVGIETADIGKLFRLDSFFSTSGTIEESGTGLGLTICKEFVEKNGGKIWVESEKGKGSIFKFTLQNAIEIEGGV